MKSSDSDARLILDEAAQRLVEGRLVAFPTETVYGLGADAENPAAIARIYAAKQRPANHPVIVHLSPEASVEYWASEVPDEAQALIDVFWPGPLTLILPRAHHIPDAVSGGQDSIGLRCPAHPVAIDLLRRFAQRKGGQGGVAAPSANKFGQVSPTRAQHVRTEFAEMSPEDLLVLEGGDAEVGIESTILDLSRLGSGMGPVLLRPGHISAKQIHDVLGVLPSGADAHAPRVSGSLKAHYAPRTPLQVLPKSELLKQLSSPTSNQRVAAVVFDTPDENLPGVDWIPADPDPVRYASRLYALLRELDLSGYQLIVLEGPPSGPAWDAVNDRIGRAAAAFLL